MKPRPSDLLIAPPRIPDPRFRKTVLMLTHDHKAGSFALCVNRPTEHTLQDIIADSGLDIDTNLNFPLFWGGPVSGNTVWMLHDADWNCEHTVPVNDQWAMTSNIDMFKHFNVGNYPKHFRLMLGYCSWGRNQLQSEIEGHPPWNHNNSWLIAENLGPEWLFEQPVELIWDSATTLCSHQAVNNWL